MKRQIKLDELHKVEASSVLPLAHKTSDLVQAIIKVKTPNYVPQCVRLRALIGSGIFTAEFKYDDLKTLEQDSKVESISISKELKSAE